jgi:outer membrane protein TolC
MSLSTTASAQVAKTEGELADLVKRAHSNPLAEAAHQRTNAANAKTEEVSGKLWPSINATTFLAPSPRVRCDNADCTQTSPKNVTVNVAGVFAGAQLNITQPLYTGGKVFYAKRAAKAASHASAALESDLAGRVAFHVAEAYYGYLLAQETIWMFEEGLEHIISGQKTLEQKIAEGSPDATVQDRFRVQALQSEVRALIADGVAGKSVALASLRALVGDDTLALQGGLLDPLPFDLESKKAKDVVDARLQAATHAVDAQRALEQYEKRGYMPDLAIVGGLRVARAQGVDDPPGAFANDPFNMTGAHVALAARWDYAPLVQSARVRKQQAKTRESLATKEAAARLGSLDWSKAVAEATRAKARLVALKEGERAGKAWVASVLQADAIGAASATDLADAYLAHFTTRASMLKTIHDWNLAVFDLRRQTGEFSRTP